ncbi:glycosyltransferase [Flavitalea flava]
MTISVIIPTYNGNRFVERAILSVLGQQRRPDEILVCDDNSWDNTLEICERYKDQISIFFNPDGPSGFVNSWNKAIARAKGEYISILHQDDMLEPEFIRAGMDALERNPGVRHLFCTCSYIDENDKVLSLSYSPDNLFPEPIQELTYTGPEYVSSYQTGGEPHIHRCPGVITHKSIFDQCRYEPSSGHLADDDFFYRVGMYTKVIGILKPYASYRIHSGSVTGSLEDADLVGKLMEDYIYQCRQWKDHPFLSPVAYAYFVRNAKKYIRRFMGYGIKQKKLKMLIKGIRQWSALYAVCHR